MLFIILYCIILFTIGFVIGAIAILVDCIVKMIKQQIMIYKTFFGSMF